MAQGARACARGQAVAGQGIRQTPQVGAGDCLIHCPHALGGVLAPVAPALQTAVATAVAEKEGAVMGIHRGPGYCFLEVVPIVAVMRTATGDAADQSIH